MKILYAAMKYDYGDPSRGYGSDHYFFYNSLKHMGHQIIYFDILTEFKQHGKTQLNQKLLKLAIRHSPDLFFSVLHEDQISPETITKLSNITTTINWFCDDTKRFDNYSKYYAPSYSWVITTEPKAVKWYKEIGYSHVVLSNWGYNHHLFKPPTKTTYKYDITFVGQPNKARVKYIQYLTHKGYKINCWGYGWPNGRINNQTKMYRLFNQSKINLNFTNTFKRKNKIMKLLTDVGIVSELTQMKARIFEVPGSKGFLLTQDVSGIEDYYQPNKEIVTFSTQQELERKINYYLHHSRSREKITKAGYYRTIINHTYEERFKNIFDQIGLI